MHAKRWPWISLAICSLLGCYRSHRLAGEADGGAVATDAEVPADWSDGLGPDLGVLRDPVVQVAAGQEHACALRQSGVVDCWGSGRGGAIGQGVDVGSGRPIRVPEVRGALALAVDYGHTCAVGAAGELWCWGDNRYNQLSDDREVRTFTPRRIPSLEPAIAVALGVRHTCAIDPGGLVRCRGYGPEGQLPNRTPADGLWGPVAVALPEPAVALDAHDKSTCALLSSGGVWCWGGMLGFDGGSRRRYREEPVPIAVAAMGVAVARGDSANLGEECARTLDGQVRCWRRSFLDVSIGTPDPRPVPGLEGVVGLDVGHSFGCAVLGSGGARCWGRNYAGQLGNGTSDESDRRDRLVLPPTPVRGLRGVVEVTTGDRFACGRVHGGHVACWGDNGEGQLGVPGLDRALGPVWLIFPE
jgi:alpha-tubulin suppressor-like RCC1 family protein